MQNVWHQGLEAHVLHTGNVFGASEIVRSPIFPTLSGIVDDCHNLCVSMLARKGKAAGGKSRMCDQVEQRPGAHGRNVRYCYVLMSPVNCYVHEIIPW